MHAYLIMAHNEFDLLKKLITTLDYENNDLFIHIDEKVESFDFESIKNIFKKSNIYLVRSRINIHWGGYTQIQGELNLLKEATQKKDYEYIHLLSGVDFPIKTNEYIHQFFNKNKGKEFISFDIENQEKEETLSRVKYFYPFQDKMNRDNVLLRKVQSAFVKLQKIIGINRLKKYGANLQVKKGMNWFSITGELAKYVLLQEKEIKKMYQYGLCVDELFLQTIVWNSPFKENITNNTMRYIDWKRGNPYVFQEDDFKELMATDKLFARKFSYAKSPKIIDKLMNALNEDEIIDFKG